MKKQAMKAVAAAVVVLSGGVAAAQTLPEPMLKAAQKAIVSNPEVQARWHNFTGAVAEKDVAAAGYKPQLDFTTGIGREEQKYPRPGVMSDYTRSGSALTLTQMLFDGMYTRNEVKRLGYAKLTRYYELLEASENIGLEAIRAYADVARYTELVEEAKANYVEHKLTAQQIEERSGAGVSRRVDLEQANGRLALAESNLLTEISNLHDVSARYLRIMGEAPPIKMPSLPEGLTFKGIPATAADTMKLGLVNSPTINAAYENVRSTKWQVESRKSAYWPRVDFRIRETWGHNVDGVSGRNGDRVAEVVLNYNLYRGGYDKAREKQAVEFQYQARDLQEKACRDVRQTLAIAYNDVVKLNEQLKYLDQHRLSTEKAKEAYRQQFDIGQRTLLDLLDTQNEYFEASRAYINARYNEIIAEARTLSSMGKLNGALGIARPDQPTLEDVGQDRGELPPEELCPFESPELVVIDKAKAVADAPVRARPAVAAPVTPSPATVPAKLTLSSDTSFDFDKSVLKPEGKKNLDDLIGKIKGSNYEVVIAVGHTDGKGSEAYNQKLSERRAESVKAYLVNQGVPATKVRAEGKGKTVPIASNDTDEGRAKNRRVEITVVPAK
jgi:outer membrane protein, adhesin transport system